MGKIYAKAVAKGSRTLKSIGDTWFDATFDALTNMVAKGEVSEDRFSEILTQAAADGIIVPVE